MIRLGLLIVISSCWMVNPSLAQAPAPDDQGSASVSGIFDGMVVGGTTRKTAGRNRATSYQQNGMHDSFAVNPVANSNSHDDIRRHRVQTRVDMIPDLDAQSSAPAQAVSAPAQPATANTITNSTQSVIRGAGQPSPEYFKLLIDQAKGRSEIAPSAPPKTKYNVTDDNRF